jgi:hypothetical protein
MHHIILNQNISVRGGPPTAAWYFMLEAACIKFHSIVWLVNIDSVNSLTKSDTKYLQRISITISNTAQYETVLLDK